MNMKKHTAQAAPRLQFADEEANEDALKKPRHQTEKAADKHNRIKATPEARKPRSQHLHFETEKPYKPKGNAPGLVQQTVRAETHRQIARNEDENIGLQAMHFTERTGESLLYKGKQMHHSKLQHEHKRLEKAERKLGHANIRYLHRTQETATPAASHSNPLSRAFQRLAIKKEYLAARAGITTSSVYSLASKAVKNANPDRKTIKALSQKRHSYFVFALIAMLVFVMNTLSSCTPLLEAGLHAFVMGTYPAEEADVKAAEHAYKAKEDALVQELRRYKRKHPGYDEYIIEADVSDIWHDPHALVSIISAYHGGKEWTIDNVYETLEMLFEWQYTVEETVITETRYRTEKREETYLVTDPVSGETRTETFIINVSIPYSYSICTATLKAENLSHAPVLIMDRERVGLYALYMSTLGNMPELFSGNPYASKLRTPLMYDVPQQLLDADLQFAKLIEAANSCLGYPYVWGGHDPSTSFDCSGFISWLFTSTGVSNIGHMGANALYEHSDHIKSVDVKPGDVVFFEGTMDDAIDGITHCGLYVGNNMMIHCGNPCTYADLTDSYWQQHFYGYGRFYDH